MIRFLIKASLSNLILGYAVDQGLVTPQQVACWVVIQLAWGGLSYSASLAK